MASATVSLHRDPWQAGWDHVLELPPWLRPRDGTTYWHAVRSAAWAPSSRHRPDRLVVRLWCGQHRSLDRLRTDNATIQLHLTATIDAPGPVCATCAGRHQARDTQGRLTFRPVDAWQLPKRCPGLDDGTGHCFACGARSRYSYQRWAGASETHHHALEPLADRYQPCPWHGWSRMAAERDARRRWEPTGRLVCTSHACPHETAPRRRRRSRRRT